jgi:hypothetical protein
MGIRAVFGNWGKKKLLLLAGSERESDRPYSMGRHDHYCGHNVCRNAHWCAVQHRAEQEPHDNWQGALAIDRVRAASSWPNALVPHWKNAGDDTTVGFLLKA